MDELENRLNLAHLAEDATYAASHRPRRNMPPQSGSFGRGCDGIAAGGEVVFDPPQSGSFGRGCDPELRAVVFEHLLRLNLAHLAEDAT